MNCVFQTLDEVLGLVLQIIDFSTKVFGYSSKKKSHIVDVWLKT
jgi:hypothetical protein